MSKYDIIIIGSGLGGLECGAILSKEGFNVCVVEKKVLILLISCMIVECLYTKGKLSVQAEAAVAAVQLFLEAVLWTGL